VRIDRTTVAEVGEHALIARIRARLTPRPWVVVGPGDDAAVVAPVRGSLDVLTTDALVEGVHFDRRFCPPEAIGHKALAVNLSDLAAMGAAPRAALLSLVLPDDFAVADLDALADGFVALADRYQVAVVGGNITRSPGPLVVDVTAVGAVGSRRILRRSGARPGDEVFVTGSVGAGAAGLQALRAAAVEAGSQPGGSNAAGVMHALPASIRAAAERYLRPEPRVRAGLMLGRNRAATACMDLSDGLADGLRQIAAESGVGMAIEGTALPIDGDVVRWFEQQCADPPIAALAGGDDYELVFTCRPAHRGRVRAVRTLVGSLPITKIGVVTKGPGMVLRIGAGERELPPGFEHFR